MIVPIDEHRHLCRLPVVVDVDIIFVTITPLTHYHQSASFLRGHASAIRRPHSDMTHPAQCFNELVIESIASAI